MKFISGILTLAGLVSGWFPLAGAQTGGQSTIQQSRRISICTSIYHLDPGHVGPPPTRSPIRVKVRYRAIPLDAKTLKAIRTNPRAQAFYNGRVLRRLVQLSTDISLKIGKTLLKPGTYDAGFNCLGKGRWRFIVVDRSGKPILREYLLIQKAEAEIPCLNLSLIPARKERGFILAARYGTLRGSLVVQCQAEKLAKGL